MKQQRSTLEKRNALAEGKSGDAVGRPSRRSSLLRDLGEKFLGGKPKSSLNSVSTCLKVVDTRRVPQSQMTSVQDVKHIPVTPGTVSHPLWGDVAQVNYGNVVGEYHRLNGRHQQLRALSLEMICMGKCHRKKERISKGELSCVLFETY
jgi:hypothetical protein